MTTLADLFPLDLLREMLEGGYVRRQQHPSLPLQILNYTERAAYDGVWNPVTLQCRGLIHETDGAGLVVARPFPKFFNYGQPGAPDLDLDAYARVTEKMDGSLGILYPTPDGYAIATRGSFASEQAIHATAVWKERYEGRWSPMSFVSALFEIVFPSNRIVCDYGDTDDLFLLGMLDIGTGENVYEFDGDPNGWPGPVVETHPYRTLAEALAAEPRPNAEGLVVSVVTGGPDVRVKIKQADYVALHRIVTGLNKRTVWAHLDAGLPIDDLIEPLPDEFRPWVEDVVAELSALVAAQAGEIEREFARITGELWGEYRCEECDGELAFVTHADDGKVIGGGWECTTGGCGKAWQPVTVPRKGFALLAKESPWSWALFMRLDGQDYGPKLWHNARPDPETPAGRVYSEDVA